MNEMMVSCPACGGPEGVIEHRHEVTAAAQHFVPRERDPQRHTALARHLHELWGQDFVDVRVCPSCGFGYAVPWVGGDACFYTLVHAGEPYYPANRWEFGQTITVLRRPEFRRGLRVLEVGAGHGAFLDRVRELGAHEIVAADYDEGAVRKLREKGYKAIAGSISDISTTGYDIVCLFQTVEHIADLDKLFAELHRLLIPAGSVFVSVPNGEAITLQERATGYWDMPPNHVGRWNSVAIRRASERRGFTVEAMESEPLRMPQVAWELAVYSVNARSYTVGTFDNRINAIAHRSGRGALKRALAMTRLPGLIQMRHEFRPLTWWAHLRRADSAHGGYV